MRFPCTSAVLCSLTVVGLADTIESLSFVAQKQSIWGPGDSYLDHGCELRF